MSIVFRKIENSHIFTSDFNPFTRNNQIVFSDQEEIAVIYGPNGTGKTSLIKALADAPNTKVEYEYDGVLYTSGTDVIHVINDQNYRNIIAGETKDFFLGDNIRREYDLQNAVTEKRTAFINNTIGILKSYGVTSAKNPLIELLDDGFFKDFIKDCANSKSKGDRFSTDNIVESFTHFVIMHVPEYETPKMDFLIKDYNKKNPIIIKIEKLADEALTPNLHVREIEENNEAISILSRFHKTQCIVCDTNGIDWEYLLETKTANREAVKQNLDPQVRDILEEIITLSVGEDPFMIKSYILQALEDGNIDILVNILREISEYKEIYTTILHNAIFEAFEQSEISRDYYEYHQLIETTPDISDEDYIFIREIIDNNMNQPLTVERDDNRHLVIKLSNQEFIGVPREELPLSTGEQNFLSLTFEFLKAKNSPAPIVVIDDPVSSFDSIYKNKVAYAIVKMLHHKKRIILTHNTDLIRLLDSQYRHCFKLYLLNNTEGELNGFIPLRRREEEMMISLEKLLKAFRNDVPRHIQNQELFLIAMIPFMRGYANIINRSDIYDQLTQVMHGYKTETVDIAQIYSNIFTPPVGTLPMNFTISVQDILARTVDGMTLVDINTYPLLNRTLKHSFVYLAIRLAIERALVERYDLDTAHNPQLGQIISAAFPDENDIDQIRARIRLTSKKTLINEFNHFEGNLSIFQPAIDITDHDLGREKTDLIAFIDSLNV